MNNQLEMPPSWIFWSCLDTSCCIHEPLILTLDKLCKKCMKLRKDKVKFMLREVEYNGFMISKNGIKLQKIKWKQYRVQKLL